MRQGKMLYPNLGKQGADIVTGFTGVISGFAEYLTGCSQLLLSPRCKEDGSRVDASWFDIDRVQIDEAVKQIVLVPTNASVTKVEQPGFDLAAPIK